jgi:hypothetical protein
MPAAIVGQKQAVFALVGSQAAVRLQVGQHDNLGVLVGFILDTAFQFTEAAGKDDVGPIVEALLGKIQHAAVILGCLYRGEGCIVQIVAFNLYT